MPIEAPYRGGPAPEGDKPAPAAADKPRDENVTIPGISADKRGSAPVEEEPEVEATETETEEIERLTDRTPGEDDLDPNTILMRADYTKKTQALAKEREALRAREAELANRYGVYEQVDRILADNPQLASTYTVEQLARLVQNGQVPDNNAPPSRAALPPEVRAELAAMRREVKETKQSLFADRAESAVRRTVAQYGLSRDQTKELVDLAVGEDLLTEDIPVERMVRRLDILARAVTYQKAEAKGQQKLVTKLKEKQRAASGGTTSAPPEAQVASPAKHRGWAGLIARHQRSYRSQEG